MLRSEGLCLRSGGNPRGCRVSENFWVAAAQTFSNLGILPMSVWPARNFARLTARASNSAACSLCARLTAAACCCTRGTGAAARASRLASGPSAPSGTLCVPCGRTWRSAGRARCGAAVPPRPVPLRGSAAPVPCLLAALQSARVAAPAAGARSPRLLRCWRRAPLPRVLPLCVPPLQRKAAQRDEPRLLRNSKAIRAAFIL